MKQFTLILSLALLLNCARGSSPPPPTLPVEPTPSQSQTIETDWLAWMHLLWNSRLGGMFKEYLELPKDSPELTEAAHRITDRIFETADGELTRVAALQALIEDLYRRGIFTDDAAKKVIILELDIARKAWAISATPQTTAMESVPYLLALSAIGGSPEVQRQVKNLGYKLYEATRHLLVRGKVERFREVPSAIEPRHLISKRFFEGYSPGSAAKSFLSVFPPGLSLYYLIFARNPQLIGQRLSDQLKMYGKDRIHEIHDL